MAPVRSRLRAGLGLLAAFGMVAGGGAVAVADTTDALDVHLSDVVVVPWAYAFERVQPAVVVSGTELPAGARVGFELFDGPGARTCDPADSLGYAYVAATIGTVSDPFYYPDTTGWLGWKAILVDSGGTVLAETSCMPTEVRGFFTDVSGEHPFFGPIQILGLNGVSEGYLPGPQFRPALAQSRQGMAAFLQRYVTKGDVAPECVGAPFADVPEDHPFCAEIAWLKAEGLTDGYADGTFRPTAPVSRQAGTAMIARALGMGEAPTCTEAEFADVPVDHPFCGAIAWLAEESGVSGYDDGTFRPNAPMSRQAMAAWITGYFGLMQVPAPAATAGGPAAGAWASPS